MPYDPQMMQQLMAQPGAPMIGTPAPGSMISPNGAASSAGVMNSPEMKMLMQALMKQKQQNLLSGNLVKPTIGQGTAGSDMATGPQGAPGNGPMVA